MRVNDRHYKTPPPMAELDEHEGFANGTKAYRVYLAATPEVANGHLPGRYYFRRAGDIGPRPASPDYASAAEAILAATGLHGAPSPRTI